MSDWKPIQTAPNDGSRVQLFDVINEACFIGRYCEKNASTGPYGRYIWRMDEDAGATAELAVTHWMPLPDPPRSLNVAPPATDTGTDTR